MVGWLDIGGQLGSTVCSSAPHSYAAEEAIPHLYKQERKRPTPVRGLLCRTKALLVGVIPAGWAPVLGMKVSESRKVVQPLHLPLVIRPLRRTYVVIFRWTYEFLWGEQRCVSWFHMPCIRPQWTGERWVEQVSWLHGTACYCKSSSFATKLSRLDDCKNRKVVRWYRTLSSSRNSQGVVDGRVSEAGVSTATPHMSAALCCWIEQGKGGCSQRCCSSIPAKASKAPPKCDAWRQFFAKWLEVSAIRERPVQRFSEVFTLGAEGQGFVVEVDFSLTLAFLVVEVEDCLQHFVLPSFSFQVWRYSFGCPVLAQRPFRCLPISISMHDFWVVTICIY